MKNKHNSFSKQTSLRSKIMVPFMAVIAIMALASIIISTYSISELMTKTISKDLKTDTNLINKELEDINSYVAFLSNLTPKFTNYTLKNLTIDTLLVSSNNTIFNKKNITLYQKNTPESLLTDTPLYAEFLSSPKLPIPNNQTLVFKKNGAFQLNIAGFQNIERQKSNYPLIINYTISNAFLKHINHLASNEIGLLYTGEFHTETVTEFVWKNALFKKNKALQNYIKRLMSQPKINTQSTYLTNTKINSTAFHIYIQQTSIHPNLYTVNIKTSENLLIAKIKIILSTLIVLLIVSLCIFGIYTLIIQKLTTSIDVLSSVSKKVSAGDFEQHVFFDASDEIGELSNIFNNMVQSLKESSINLIKEKERSEAIISCMPEGIIVTDKENRLILANSKAEEMFNFSTNEVQGSSLLKYINNEDLKTVFNENLNEQTDVITREVQLENNKNEEDPKFFSLTSSIVKNNKNEQLGFITVLRDISHEKQIEELREGFLRTVSHELRTPLTSVMGFIELVQSGSGGKNISEKQKGYLATSLKEASNLKNLIDDLLDLSQFKAGKIKMNIEQVTVKTLIDNIITTLSPLAKGKNLKLISTLNDSRIKIDADVDKLRRILLNIISNAIKFTPEGSISISIKRQADCLEFAIEDTGIGLKEEEKDVIFEKFRQVDYSSTRKYEGIGLGLSIVKKLVNMHKGTIWVESEYGKGSVFHFTIMKGLS